MIRLAGRIGVAVTLAVLSVAMPGARPAWGQEPAGTGHKDVGESVSAWHGVLAFLGRVLLALVVYGLVVWIAIGRRRGATLPPTRPLLPGPARHRPHPRPRGTTGAARPIRRS